MPLFDRRFIVDAPLARVRAFHERADALRRLTPAPVRVDGAMPPLRDGERFEFALFAPWPVRWRGHYERVEDDGFDDVMDEGPFARWRHEHRYRSLAPERTEVHDRIDAAFGGLTSRVIWAGLPATFRYRAMATRRACRPPLQQIS